MSRHCGSWANSYPQTLTITFGTLDVDAQSGAIFDRAQGVAAIRAQVAQVAVALSVYRPNLQVVAESLACDAVTAENLSPEEKA